MKKSFTLIELLAVILIIGVLGSLLFGGATLVQKFTNRTACANNLRDIMMSMKAYSSNTSGQTFPGPIPWGKKHKDVTADDILVRMNNVNLTDKQLKKASYGVDDEVSVRQWVCPVDPEGNLNSEEQYRRSYIYNVSLREPQGLTLTTISEGDIAAPSRTVAWMDAHYGLDSLLGGSKKATIQKYDDFKKLVEYWDENGVSVHGRAKAVEVNVVMYDGSAQRFDDSYFINKQMKKTFEKHMYLDGK